MIGASDLGNPAEATHFPEIASTKLALTEELPMSYPNKYIIKTVI
jgi:hypothetical protein